MMRVGSQFHFALRASALCGPFLSLAPGFSRVFNVKTLGEPFQRFAHSRETAKPLKRFCSLTATFTRLKPGANKRSGVRMS